MNESASTNPLSLGIPSSRCCHCPPPNSGGGKNIVVCIDGTSNQFGLKNTNVLKMFDMIHQETTPQQEKAYFSGIGTAPASSDAIQDMGTVVTNIFDMALGWTVAANVKEAYRWLAEKYQAGDRIYLFGFSRGAYQVRLLAGMIYEVGLLKDPRKKQIATAYQHYDNAMRSRKSETRRIAREFKATFSWSDLRVHFVGVWDTVASIFGSEHIPLSASSSAAHACHFRHALALDERRVQFMPEYFHEVNSQVSDGESMVDRVSDFPEGKEHVNVDIKEVWFAGCHSDVGGVNIFGQPRKVGNFSLLWMRREAAEHGLALKPLKMDWILDGFNFDISNSMSFLWQIMEHIPIKHQTSFSGPGTDIRRQHLAEPRRIIPKQKIHTSILYADAYVPQATMGEGFNITMKCTTPEEADLDEKIWEGGLFDHTVAQTLLDSLSGRIEPACLSRLLFMLQFEEGRQCVRIVHNWRGQFKSLIRNAQTQFVRFNMLIAYYEVAYDTAKGEIGTTHFPEKFDDHIYDDAKMCLREHLDQPKDIYSPRVVALLGLLAKHEVLRDRVLVPEMNTLVKLLDLPRTHLVNIFGQVMDGLSCLLRCEQTRSVLIRKLMEASPQQNYSRSRLCQILEVEDIPLLTAALRMVLIFVQIPEVEITKVAAADCPFWFDVKHRIRELAKKDYRLVGCLAVEILFTLFDVRDRDHLDVHNPRVRTNIASALMHLELSRHNAVDGRDEALDLEHRTLYQLFGLGASVLDRSHIKCIEELRIAVKHRDAKERTAGTLTLLRLCETKAIRDHLRGTRLLDTFTDQLQRKDSALLAAYALSTCMHYDFRESEIINNSLLPGLVGMVRMGCFDDAVGQVDGSQIFRDLMRNDHLREGTKNDIVEILQTKIEKGKDKEIRTSLVYFDILVSFDPDGIWCKKLVGQGLNCLRGQVWKEQRKGVILLSALAKTTKGAGVVSGSIPDIIKMLLPNGCRPTRQTRATLPPDTCLPTEWETPTFYDRQTPPTMRTSMTSWFIILPPDLLLKSCLWMTGPAYVLWNLAQNEKLREHTLSLQEFVHLKHLHMDGTLAGKKTDASVTLHNMIKAIEEGLGRMPHVNRGCGAAPCQQ